MADPVEDFLAREQEELAGIDDDLTSAPQDANVNGNGLVDTDADFFAGSNEDYTEGTTEIASFNDDSLTNGSAHEESQAPQYNVTMPRVVPDKILRWQEEQNVRLETKDKEEKKKINDMKEQAQKELADFNKNRKEQIEKSKKLNREAEAEFLRERDADRPGKEWERIAGMCEFNPKASKNSKDMSRMRSLLLQLKVSK